MRITVIGCGRWGSFISWYLDGIGHRVTLYGRASSERFRSISERKSNGTVSFSERILFSSELHTAAESAEIIIIAVNSQALRGIMSDLSHVD